MDIGTDDMTRTIVFHNFPERLHITAIRFNRHPLAYRDRRRAHAFNNMIHALCSVDPAGRAAGRATRECTKSIVAMCGFLCHVLTWLKIHAYRLSTPHLTIIPNVDCVIHFLKCLPNFQFWSFLRHLTITTSSNRYLFLYLPAIDHFFVFNDLFTNSFSVRYFPSYDTLVFIKHFELKKWHRFKAYL